MLTLRSLCCAQNIAPFSPVIVCSSLLGYALNDNTKAGYQLHLIKSKRIVNHDDWRVAVKVFVVVFVFTWTVNTYLSLNSTTVVARFTSFKLFDLRQNPVHYCSVLYMLEM